MKIIIYKNLLQVSLTLVAIFLISTYYPSNFGTIDFMQYWAAANLFLAQANPYDSVALYNLEKSTSPWHLMNGFPIIMWNPPFIFPFIVPFALFSFEFASKFWILVSLIFFALGINNILETLKRKPSPFTTCVLALTFYPIYDSIYWGQISPLLLLSLSAALITFSRGKTFIAGILLCATLIKPHLLYLYYFSLILNFGSAKNRTYIFGFITGGITLIGISLFIEPHIINNYFALLSQPPTYWHTPTLGSWLQYLSGNNSFFIRSSPSIFAVVFLFSVKFFSPSLAKLFSDPRILIPLSLFTSPYGWIYDQVLLIPSLIFLAPTSKDRFSRNVFYATVFVNLLCFIPFSNSESANVWYPFAIFILCFIKLQTKNISNTIYD